MNVDGMDELIDIVPDINVQETEYKRLLGYPGDYVLHGQVGELMDLTRRWYTEYGRPWIYARRAETLDLVDARLIIDGMEFASKRFHGQLTDAQAHQIIMVAVSAGKSLEEKARQLWREEKPDEYFFMEIYGSAVVEHLITTAGARFCEWGDQHRMAVLPHYSPGYPGWDISDQNKLLRLIQDNRRHDIPEEIRVMESGMLRPKKSLLALFGITSRLDRVERLTTLVPCKNCSMPSCQYRRVPYKNSLPQVEDVHRLRFNWHSSTAGSNQAALDTDAKYSFNSRALQKWSRERLQLKILDDRSVEAQFRYKGTTCSNIGRTLEFDYHVKLSSSEERYRIVDARCVPAPGDDGHRYMCQYLDNGDTFINAIAEEKPLLGMPLRDVLIWKREYSPSGCYCAAPSREHKWGIVLEVLHYALAQYDRQRTKNDKRESITTK